MPAGGNRVTVLFFHPYPRRSQMNRALRDAAAACPGVQVRDMYETYPDFGIDVGAEQDLLLRTDVLVLQHPFYLYSCPALMKEWLDAVFELGWAYGDAGTKLAGKGWMQVITAGASEDSFRHGEANGYPVAELLRPFEQTARLCGMRPLEPFVVYAAGRVDPAAREAVAQRYRAVIEAVRDGAAA